MKPWPALWQYRHAAHPARLQRRKHGSHTHCSQQRICTHSHIARSGAAAASRSSEAEATLEEEVAALLSTAQVVGELALGAPVGADDVPVPAGP